MAAPVAAKNAGLIAVGDVEGAKTVVCSLRTDFKFCAIFGVCAVPPDNMTCQSVSRCKVEVLIKYTSSMSSKSRSAFFTASSISRVKL